MFFSNQSKFFLFLLSSLLALSGILQLGPRLAQASELQAQRSTNEFSLASFSKSQSPSTGLISGQLFFPSEQIPPLTIFAIRKDNGLDTFYSIQTAEGQSRYSLRVDPGVYQVLAYAGELAGGFTRYVKCGMGSKCQDHSLASVVVESGAILSWIDIKDWYAPAGTFPARPDGGEPAESSIICSTYHTVKSGENLFRIGLSYDLTWKPIAQVNDLANPNLIYAGQVLCIPRSVQPSTQKPTPSSIPTFEILNVVKNKQVTIKTYNFPPDTDFMVTMGKIGTRGIDGLKITTINSGQGGTITATFPIPSKLHGQYQVSIRIQSSTGFYSYNWFYNNTTS
jgi:hypothetical protein